MASCACSRVTEYPPSAAKGNRYAAFFELFPGGAVSISPFTGQRDTLLVDLPFGNVVCMSTSYAACFSEIGCDSCVTAVSGVRFLSNSRLRERLGMVETGHEGAFDYEAVLGLNPDVVLAYSVSAVEPQYVTRLKALGVKVFMLYDHLESHPLARAEYVRLAGQLTGRMAVADSVFDSVSGRYGQITDSVAQTVSSDRVKVLLNLPYADMWYIPGERNYMSRLISDAGGEVLGARKGRIESSAVSMETAYRLSLDADFWLNTGNCRTRAQIESQHPFLKEFGPMGREHCIFNNISRTNDAGGNDFWESGALHPELVLSDLVSIFGTSSGTGNAEGLHYYLEVE